MVSTKGVSTPSGGLDCYVAVLEWFGTDPTRFYIIQLCHFDRLRFSCRLQVTSRQRACRIVNKWKFHHSTRSSISGVDARTRPQEAVGALCERRPCTRNSGERRKRISGALSRPQGYGDAPVRCMHLTRLATHATRRGARKCSAQGPDRRTRDRSRHRDRTRPRPPCRRAGHVARAFQDRVAHTSTMPLPAGRMDRQHRRAARAQ
jgi:hypothetical protein